MDTSTLLPHPSYCKQCCNEHGDACVRTAVEIQTKRTDMGTGGEGEVGIN